jgi:Tol biopolymer transport system component
VTLAAGTKLGPYEILAPIGAGGMGEVFRARDPRLGREVAIKVLPPSFSHDADRLKRFEQEARSASALNHPNIVTIHEIGSVDGTSYMAMELIDGVSLRETLASGPLPTKKFLDVAVQVAEALAKAHSAGIVHRDLKPENVMVTKDGYVKLLDFGLAKLFVAPQDGGSGIATAIHQETTPGTVMGTVGYMSPEQASGRPVDFRSDQFSLGSILYEMATGHRAFQKGTGAQTLAAIIQDEPEPLAQASARTPAPLRWIVERCLAKDPDERYASTRDLARDLKSVREHIGEVTSTSSGAAAIVEAAPRKSRKGLLAVAAAAVLAAGLVGGVAIGRKGVSSEPPTFRQLTFRRGSIQSARFAPDGQTILYTAAWDGKPIEVFVNRTESPESRPFGMVGADVLAVSNSGEMALSLQQHQADALLFTGTLARMGVAGGGAPREILENVQWADWSPDGQSLAIVRDFGPRNRLEYPIGKVLYETSGFVSHPRVSRKGDWIAFADHPSRGDDSGVVAVTDPAGKRKTLTSTIFATVWGVSWSPDGREIWFTAAPVGGNRSLYAVDLSGKMRLLARVTGSLSLFDVSSTGRVLLAHDQRKQQMMCLGPGSTSERELSWLDYGGGESISADGGTIYFEESGEGGGPGYSAYIRKTDGSPAVRLGPGSAFTLSPDGKWALAIVDPAGSPELVIYPTGVGETKKLPRDGLDVYIADWLPDQKRLLLAATEKGHGMRLYLRDVDGGGKPRAISPEGYVAYQGTVSPDGKVVAVRGPDQRRYLYPLEGGEPTPIPGVTEDDTPYSWTGDGKFLYVAQRRDLPRKVDRVEVATGRRERWKELRPQDAAGVVSVGGIRVTPDSRYYVYTYSRTLSDLYLVEGLK